MIIFIVSVLSGGILRQDIFSILGQEEGERLDRLVELNVLRKETHRKNINYSVSPYFKIYITKKIDENDQNVFMFRIAEFFA